MADNVSEEFEYGSVSIKINVTEVELGNRNGGIKRLMSRAIMMHL